MKRSRLAAVLVFAIACSRSGEQKKASPDTVGTASGTVAVDSVPKALSGTRWSLVEIQSMRGTPGTTRPDDPAKYTLAFDTESSDSDGLLSMRLDCNQAHGGYQAKRVSGQTGGSLTIGPLAVTRALCAPTSLSDRVARDMGAVRSYRIVNGHLAFSLMADSAIYVWQRDTTRR